MRKDGSRNHLYPRSHPGETQYFSLITKPPVPGGAFLRRYKSNGNPSTIPAKAGAGASTPQLSDSRSLRSRSERAARAARPPPSGRGSPRLAPRRSRGRRPALWARVAPCSLVSAGAVAQATASIIHSESPRARRPPY